MAKVFGSQVDLQKIPVVGLVPYSNATAPASPVAGQLWWDTTAGQLKVCTNAVGPVWTQCDNVTGGAASNVTDGDKGVITVTGGVWSLDAGTVGSSQIIDGTIAVGDLAFTPVKSGDAAGGDLTGTYPNPTIGLSKVGTANIIDSTITSADLNTSSVRLDTIGSAGADVSMSSFRLTSLATPTAGNDAATKSYVDSVSQGLDAKASVLCATTATLPALNTSAPSSVDGIGLSVGDRVLVKDQGATANNGIYTVTTVGTGANGVWARAADMDAWTEVPGAYVFVERGGTNADTGWLCTADQGGTLGSTAITWVQFSAAGQIVDGIGLLKTGNTLDVRLDNTTIEAPSDILQVKDSGITGAKIANGAVDLGFKVTSTLPVGNGGTGSSSTSGARSNLSATANPLPQKFASTLGAMSAGTEVTVTHSLNTKDIVPAFRLVSTDVVIDFTWRAVDANTIGITADVAQSASSIRMTVIG